MKRKDVYLVERIVRLEVSRDDSGDFRNDRHPVRGVRSTGRAGIRRGVGETPSSRRQPSDVSPLPGGRFVSIGPLQVVISVAYGIPFNPSQRLKGLPEWTLSRDAFYDIEATGTVPPGLPVKERTDRIKTMLQTLLADRFKLVVHHETKSMPVYALSVNKGGPKLERANVQEENCPEATPTPGTRNTECGLPQLHGWSGTRLARESRGYVGLGYYTRTRKLDRSTTTG